PRRQTQPVCRAAEQSSQRQLRNLCIELPRRLAELLTHLSQLYSPVQPQSQKETLLQRLRPVDLRSLPFRRDQEPIILVRGGEAHALARSSFDRQHRMRVHAKAGIRLPGPVLQVVLRREPCPREIRNLVLLDSRRAQPLAGGLIELRREIVVRNKMRMVP